jgi:hypothetical protein
MMSALYPTFLISVMIIMLGIFIMTGKKDD